MRTSKQNVDKHILSLTIPVPSIPHDVQLDGTLEWGLPELRAVIKEPLLVATRISDYWKDICQQYGKSLYVKISACYFNEMFSLKVEVRYKSPKGSHSIDGAETQYAHIIKAATLEAIRILNEYNESVDTTGSDISIVYEESQLGSKKQIISSNNLAVCTTQKWLMSDAKAGSKRPEIKAYFDKYDEVTIPRSPARYPTQANSESITFTGFFNVPDDIHHTGELWANPHRKICALSFSSNHRDSIMDAQKSRSSVTATVRKNFYTVGGASAFAHYELLTFTTLDSVQCAEPNTNIDLE